MKRLFVDTAGWMAMADANDPGHDNCRNTRDQWLEEKGIFVSTDYVMDEIMTLLRVRLGIRAAQKWWEQIENSSRVRWEWIDPRRTEKARGWFFQWQDKDFSFTDCTSFVVMRDLHLSKALTTDHHFRQAGFEVVP